MSKSFVYVMSAYDDVQKITEGAVVLDLDEHRDDFSLTGFLSKHRQSVISVEGVLSASQVYHIKRAIEDGVVHGCFSTPAVEALPFTGTFIFVVDSLKQIPVSIADCSIVR